jgi:hypothetical protein
MTPELTALTLAALLQVVQFVLLSVPANLELGPNQDRLAARPGLVARWRSSFPQKPPASSARSTTISRG